MLINIRYSIKFAQIRRLVSTATAFLFLLTMFGNDLALASPDTRLPATQSVKSRFVIPTYLGYVKDEYSHDPAGRTIIHIQDAHCNYRAQNAIYELVDYLSKRYRVKIVNLEGGEGRYDLSQFNLVKDKNLREKTADYFLREGIINGPEFYAVKNPGKIRLWGVEDTSLYAADLDVYRRSLASKPETEKLFAALSYNLSLVKNKAYPKALIEMDLKSNSFKANSIDIKEYSAYLLKCAYDNKVDTSSLANLAILTRTMDLEKMIDFKKSNSERDELIAKLAKYLPRSHVEELTEKTMEFKFGRLAPSEFYLYVINAAKSADIASSSYANLARYNDYISTYDGIKKEELFNELSALEDSIKERLFSDPAQRRLDRVTKDLAILKGILNITITPEEFRVYKGRLTDFDIKKIRDVIVDAAREYGVDINPVPDIQKTISTLSNMSNFYNLSYKRDDAFIKNIKGKEVAILITGGFHTDNLTRLLKDHKINYVSIMPNFRLDGIPCPYLKRLAGEKPALVGRALSSRSAIALYTYFCENAKEIYGGDVRSMTAKWIRIVSELISNREALAGGDLRFVISDSKPDLVSGERAEEIPGTFFNGGKVYAIRHVSEEILKPRSIVLKNLTFIFLVCVAAVLAVMGVNPPSAHASSFEHYMPPITNMAAASKLYKVVDKMWEDSNISGILSQYEATDKPHKVQAMADLTLDYFAKIAPPIIQEYKGYAKMANLPDAAWVVFAALELTETSGAQIVDPGNLDKLVNQQDGGMGPLQVMKAQCNALNRYMDNIQKQIDAGTMKSAVDRRKMGILEKFGFTSKTHIDINKIHPYSDSYDRAYSCLSGAAIMALNNYAFSERYFQPDDEKGFKYAEDGAKYSFTRLEDPLPIGPGYDQLLATIASYNLGFDNIRDLLVDIGPWHGIDHIEWYKKFLVGLETKITQSHNVRFRTFITMILYIFPDNLELRTALQSLGYDVDFIRTEQIKADFEAKTGLDHETIVESPSAQNSAQPEAASQHDIQPTNPSIFLTWPFWAGLSFVVFMGTVLPVLFMKFMGFTIRVNKKSGNGDLPRFVSWNSINDRRFIANELSDDRFTVVFDMDKTLVWDDPLKGTFYLRPFTKTLIDILKQRGIKLVMWTSASRARLEQVSGSFPELMGSFDIVIYDHQGQKDLDMLGYQVLIGHDLSLAQPAPGRNFKTIEVNPFDFDYMIDRGGMDQERQDKLEDAIFQDTELMSTAWRQLIRMVPSEIGQMGKRAEVVGIDKKNLTAKVRNAEGRVEDLNLALDPNPMKYLRIVSSAFETALPASDFKRATLKMLSLFEKSPPGTLYAGPSVDLEGGWFYTYSDLIDDLAGFSSAHFNCIAIHESLSHHPIALFHEIGEYCIKSGSVQFELLGRGVLMVKAGDRIFSEKLSPEALAIANKDPLNQHYLLRAFQRQLFGQLDRDLTSRIKHLQQTRGYAVERPLDSIDPGEINNILIYATDSPHSSDPKLGESIINQWPLISGLRTKYPAATIYVVTNYPHLYLSGHFDNKVVPIPLDAEDWPGSRYSLDTMSRSEETRLNFLSEYDIDMVFQVSASIINRFPMPTGSKQPYTFLIETPVSHVKAEDMVSTLLWSGTSAATSVAMDMIHSGHRLPGLFTSNPEIPVFLDNKGRAHSIASFGSVVRNFSSGTEMANAGVWRLSMGIYNSLGLNVNEQNLDYIKLSQPERSDAVALFGSWHDRVSHDAEPFNPSRKVFVVNVYARTHRDDIMSDDDWVELISRLATETDAYLVFTSGGEMDMAGDAHYGGMTRIEAIYDRVAKRIGEKANHILIPRDDIYPLINNILGIADGVITIDTGFSHLASGVYNIPTAILTKRGVMHWLTPRDRMQPFVKDRQGIDINEVVNYVKAIAEHPAEPRVLSAVEEVAITPEYIKETSRNIGAVLSDSYIMTKGCTIGMVVKSEPGQDADMILAKRFAGAMESIGHRVARKVQISRGVIQYDAGGIKYIAYVDDGTDSPENIDRINSFRDSLEASGDPKERRFAWVFSGNGNGSGKSPQARLDVISELSNSANLVGLKGEYLPVSWQMLVGPLFANLIYSKSQPETNTVDRIDAIIDSIIRSISQMTRTEIGEWNSLRQELRAMSKDDLSRKFNGTFFIKLPPMLPVTDAIEQCRKADLEVQTAL